MPGGQVLWQLGNLCEQLGDVAKAQQWFSLVVTAPRGPTEWASVQRIPEERDCGISRLTS